jgi:hypothetical protein
MCAINSVCDAPASKSRNRSDSGLFQVGGNGWEGSKCNFPFECLGVGGYSNDAAYESFASSSYGSGKKNWGVGVPSGPHAAVGSDVGCGLGGE